MKTETAIVLVVVIIGALSAYKIFSRQQIIAANTPLGANVGTLQAAGAIAAGIPSFIGSIENAFGSNNANTGYTDTYTV